MPRLYSIDVLRATAILLMVQVHFIQNLSPRTPDSAALYDLSEILGLFPAPIFTFLVGLSLRLWIQKQQASDDKTFGIQIIRRGLFLFGYGLSFAVVIWLPDQVFIWDILTFIGLATVIVFAVRNWSSLAIIIASAMILFVSPPLRELTGYAYHWTSWGEYYYNFTMTDVLLGVSLHGYFPLLPWIIFPLMGFVTGRYLFRQTSGSDQTKWLTPILGGGLIVTAMMITFLSQQPPFSIEGYAPNLNFYPASTQFVLGMLGLILISLWTLHRWLDDRLLNSRLRFFQLYSRYSLTTYIIHHAVHIWFLYLAAARAGSRDPFFYYANAVSTPVALVLVLMFVIGFYGVLVLWDRHKGRYSFEWQLRILSK